MPVRRRSTKRRASATIEQWAIYLESGFDFFDDLPDAGVEVDDHGKPSREEALAAWEAYGLDLMERWRKQRAAVDQPAWAVEQFGEPRSRGLRRCR
jgi:hypothetical protein